MEPVNTYSYPCYIKFWWQYQEGYPIYEYILYTDTPNWYHNQDANDPRLMSPSGTDCKVLCYVSVDGSDWTVDTDSIAIQTSYKVTATTDSNFIIYNADSTIYFVPTINNILKPIRLKKITSYGLVPVRLKKATLYGFVPIRLKKI